MDPVLLVLAIIQAAAVLTPALTEVVNLLLSGGEPSDAQMAAAAAENNVDLDNLLAAGQYDRPDGE